jgi:hypothetical protein
VFKIVTIFTYVIGLVSTMWVGEKIELHIFTTLSLYVILAIVTLFVLSLEG